MCTQYRGTAAEMFNVEANFVNQLFLSNLLSLFLNLLVWDGEEKGGRRCWGLTSATGDTAWAHASFKGSGKPLCQTWPDHSEVSKQLGRQQSCSYKHTAPDKPPSLHNFINLTSHTDLQDQRVLNNTFSHPITKQEC